MEDYHTNFISDKFGTVKLNQTTDIIAGSYCQLEFTITIGKYGIDDGGHIKIAWPVHLEFLNLTIHRKKVIQQSIPPKLYLFDQNTKTVDIFVHLCLV